MNFEEGRDVVVLKDTDKAMERWKDVYTAGSKHKVNVMAVWYLFCAFGYTGIYMCQNSLNCSFKVCT